MDELFRKLDDLQFGARLIKRPVLVKHSHSGISILYLLIVFALALFLFLILFLWPNSK